MEKDKSSSVIVEVPLEKIKRDSAGNRNEIEKSEIVHLKEEEDGPIVQQKVDEQKSQSQSQKFQEKVNSLNAEKFESKQIKDGKSASSKTGEVGMREDEILQKQIKALFVQEAGTHDKIPLKPLRRPKIIYEPTYQLEPFNAFSPSKVDKIIEDTLEEMLTGFNYQPEKCAEMAKKVSEAIRTKVLAQKYDRYKIIALVQIGPFDRQGIHIGFRCLWDAERDRYSVKTFKNISLFAVASVYASYYD